MLCHFFPFRAFVAFLSLFSLLAEFTAARSHRKHFQGRIHDGGSYRLSADSNICETTPGVHTYSGYINIDSNHSIFFWFFEARNNPKTAPFTLWLNGGPGCSSLIGAFQENGPCKVNAQGNSTTLNPYSWNKYSHILYLDQPIPAGFSYGVNDIYSSAQAAHPVWKLFQIFFSIPNFATYESRELSFWAESYGGQYGPKFTEYFESQNDLINSGKMKGHLVRPTSLGITNGWFDPYYHFQSYYDYSLEKYNHVANLLKPDVLACLENSLYSSQGCLAQVKQCASTGNNTICQQADDFCTRYVSTPAMGDRNPYFFEHPRTDPFPSESYVKYLSRPEVMSAIGAESQFSECPDAPNNDFTTTGDAVRSSIPSLAKILNKGLRTVIWAGDRDFICNTLGGYRSIHAMDWKYAAEFREAKWQKLTFNGQPAGIFKRAGPLTYITVYNAGHEIPAYKPELALEIFRQTISQEPIHSTPKEENVHRQKFDDGASYKYVGAPKDDNRFSSSSYIGLLQH